mgnify:CR=1 FL=1
MKVIQSKKIITKKILAMSVLIYIFCSADLLSILLPRGILDTSTLQEVFQKIHKSYMVLELYLI